MKTITILVAVVATLTCLASNVLADLTSIDLVEDSGDGLLTFDSDTGYEWLDLTETVDLSYNYVSGQLGTGGDFEGFTVASTEEVQDLFRHGGWTGDWNSTSTDSTDYNNAVTIIELLEATNSGSGSTSTWGMVEDFSTRGQYVSMLYTEDAPTSSSLHTFTQSSAVTSSTVGTFLYRPPVVPVPAAGLLGLLGLGAASAKLHRRRELIDE